MIAYVRGKLVLIQEESIILEVNGLGYEIICPNPFIYQQNMHQELFIHTYHHVREDIQCLFGFQHEDEKSLFTKLIAVSGIGPKSANTILGAVQVSDFISAVEMEDEKYLTQFPGVGKKTARQIILDLKGKLSGLFSIGEAGATDQSDLLNDKDLSEVKEALKTLGYSQGEMNHIMPALKQSDLTETEALVKHALELLVK